MSKLDAYECDYCGDMVVNDRFEGKKLKGWGTTYGSDVHICTECREKESFEMDDLKI